MDSSFFRSWYHQPSDYRDFFSQSPSVRGKPFYPTREYHVPVHQRNPGSGRKVVQIPVHFVGSNPEPADLALKIQKAFRGFLARRSVEKIREIKIQVDKIGERLLKGEQVEKIKRDEREGLKMTESLMALLFKLDSIRGVDSGIRDLRKAVIKKAIALQEKIDAIVSIADEVEQVTHEIKENVHQTSQYMSDESSDKLGDSGEKYDNFEEPVDQNLERVSDGNSGKFDVSDENFEDLNVPVDFPVGPRNNDLDAMEVTVEGSNAESDLAKLEKVKEDPKNSEDSTEELRFSPDEEALLDQSAVEDEGGQFEDNHEKTEVVDGEIDCEVKVDEASCVDIGIRHGLMKESLIESDGKVKMGDDVVQDDEKVKGGLEDGSRDDNKRNSELLERMMEENEKMMSLMTRLMERNEMQTRMLNTLTHRVEQLEKAFVCDRLSRSKKKTKKNHDSC